MENYSKTLSENITAYRKERGYTQEALAEKLGITFQAVSKWENEQSSPDILTLPQLAEIFGVSIDELFGKKPKSLNQETHGDLVLDSSWLDDKTLRGVVFLGHKMLSSCDDMSKFTFKLDGQPLNVVSYCNIECNGNIAGDAKAECAINCVNIYGDANAGCGINCGNVEKSVSAGCGVNCGNVGGSIDAGQDVNCGNVDGSVECQDIKCGTINGSVQCQNIECEKIMSEVHCQGNIHYK